MKHKDLTNPAYLTWRSFLKRSEDWDRERIEYYQLQSLKHTLKRAYQTAGYHQRFNEASVTPSDLKTLDDIRKFPTISKEDIRDNLSLFTAQAVKGEYVTTGGSTGIPFGFYRSKQAFARELASKAHQYARLGWQEGDKQFVLRGLKIDSENHVEFVEQFNELRCSSYHLVPEIMEHYLVRAWEYDPDWIRCYPSAGTLFARWLKETDSPFPTVKGILCASENLYDWQRELLKEVFNCRVFSHYGHYELAALAGYCEYENTYHVLPQYGYVELLDENYEPVAEAGQKGEIVATSFIMEPTLFVRYRTQDIATYLGEECDSCGRPYQIWKQVDGRLHEFIVTKTGRKISMTAINMHDETFDVVKQFQFKQWVPGVVVLRFIPKPNWEFSELDKMERNVQEKLGDDVELLLQPVEEIPLTQRGKHRFLLQELDVGWD